MAIDLSTENPNLYTDTVSNASSVHKRASIPEFAKAYGSSGVYTEIVTFASGLNIASRCVIPPFRKSRKSGLHFPTVTAAKIQGYLSLQPPSVSVMTNAIHESNRSHPRPYVLPHSPKLYRRLNYQFSRGIDRGDVAIHEESDSSINREAACSVSFGRCSRLRLGAHAAWHMEEVLQCSCPPPPPPPPPPSLPGIQLEDHPAWASDRDNSENMQTVEPECLQLYKRPSSPTTSNAASHVRASSD
ncbi:hypothetical protein WN55_04418 [Dufourea novaeangliae]|uniref:Uncharacterized protein n=1 Tax=Dufourea novaeangliae TaxID=178035 RepID=A0A154PNV5_DUFNO|nr:hypothetical protein WN55_04418 [Dufourea novaeangliae]